MPEAFARLLYLESWRNYFGDFVVTDADFAFDGVAGSVEVALINENFVGVFANGELFEQRFAENCYCFFGTHFQGDAVPDLRYRPSSACTDVYFSQFDAEVFEPFILGAFWRRFRRSPRNWRGGFKEKRLFR